MYVSAIQPSGISVLSNPSLKPETVWSAEAGADWTPLPAVLAKATVFQNWSSNLIINKQVTATTQQRDNVDRVETHGTELELRWKAAKAWSTSLAYAYTHADIVYDSGLNAGHDLPVTPRNKFAWGLDFDEPKLFAAGLRLRYKDLFYVDPENTVLVHPYWNLDAGISRKFGRLEARLDVENVIDTHYDVFDLAATAPLMSPGRVVSGSLRASF
jgi:outer membrane receptor protein involved in Fe transport